MFAGTSPASSNLLFDLTTGFAPPPTSRFNGTEYYLRFRASGAKLLSEGGFRVKYKFVRTWYVGPNVLGGQDHKTGVWSHPLGSIHEAVRRADSGDTIVLYPGLQCTAARFHVYPALTGVLGIGRYRLCGIRIDSKAIKIVSMSGSEFTTLDCQHNQHGEVDFTPSVCAAC